MTSVPDDLVRTTRRLYALFAEGNVPGLLAMLQPDVEWAEPENPFNPAGGTRHGHAGVVEWLTVGHASEEILSLEPRIILTAPDTVAVVGTSTCRVRSTGRTYTTEFVHVIRFRDGKVAGFREYFDTFAAAEAFRPR